MKRILRDASTLPKLLKNTTSELAGIQNEQEKCSMHVCYDINFLSLLIFSGNPIPRMDYTEQEIKTW